MSQLVKLFIIVANTFFLFGIVFVIKAITTDFVSEGVHVISEDALQRLVGRQYFLFDLLRVDLSVVSELVLQNLTCVWPVFGVMTTHLFKNISENGRRLHL